MDRATDVVQYYFCAMTVEQPTAEATCIPVSNIPPTGEKTKFSILVLPVFSSLAYKLCGTSLVTPFLNFPEISVS